ncbi:NADPH-dependent FMN reductase [Mucilaginibacter jinjuensis]|uniref:NAD(P)H-dependent oxidoreductase n=1 Tax=Mucilaginibacter jinjuensis TaxID=1176721 RepID=A0ABY7T483_9SPHI|nr:NAD(P)H-dependent oxidoreductase [Mucilaginibacter jinjuensis]WCT10551.1 NAD(P)H-dependent oxidoreductase [Mucilaginibacter jinjuensis]
MSVAKPLNIMAISGSLRIDSSNTSILKFLQSIVPQHNFWLYDGLDKLPHFNPALDNEHPPIEIQNLRKAITEADGIIICTPEYAFGVPGSLKNMLDWTVSSGSLVDKPVALITASSVGESAHASLLKTLEVLTANIVKGGTLLIPFIRAKMNAENQITDEQTEQNVQNVLKALLAAIAQS